VSNGWFKIKCECGQVYLFTLGKCPNCGYVDYYKMKNWGYTVMILFLLSFFIFVGLIKLLGIFVHQ